MVALTVALFVAHARQPGARRGPGLLHPRRCSCRRRLARAHQARSSRGRGERAARTPPSRTSSRSPGFDFLSAAQKTNAGDAFVTAEGLVGTNRPADGRAQTAPAIRRIERQVSRRLVLGFNPPPIFGIGHDRRLRVLHAEPRRGRRADAWRRQPTRWLQRRTSDPSCAACSTQFSTAVPQYQSTSTARRRRRSACRSTTSSTRMQATLGSLLRQRLQQCTAAPGR